MSPFRALPPGPGAHPPRWRRRRTLPAGVDRATGAEVARTARFLVEEGGSIVLGPTARIGAHCELRAGPGATVTVDGTLGERCRLSAQATITVEAGARLGEGCVLIDWDPACADAERPVREQGTLCAPIVVAADAVLGHGAAVLRGVRVGERADVLAHAVCTHDVPADGQFPDG